MEITGKEYKKILAISSIDVYAIIPNFMKADYEGRTGNIWDKRKCFICGKKFKQGELVTAMFTKKGINKLSCSICYQKNKKEWESLIKKVKYGE